MLGRGDETGDRVAFSRSFGMPSTGPSTKELVRGGNEVVVSSIHLASKGNVLAKGLRMSVLCIKRREKVIDDLATGLPFRRALGLGGVVGKSGVYLG